jgi:hypothetical protein
LRGRLNGKDFTAADPDNDRTLDKNEFVAMVEKRFKAADPDNDARLTPRSSEGWHRWRIPAVRKPFSELIGQQSASLLSRSLFLLSNSDQRKPGAPSGHEVNGPRFARGVST